MAYNTYTIYHSDKTTVLTTIAPQTVDNTTALTLIGQADANYGQQLDQNFIYLLENFANTSSPAPPIQGMLWYNKTNGLINLYDSTQTWEPIATQAWVEQNFTASGSLGVYATESYVQAYVGSQGFVTPTYLTTHGYLTGNQTITLTGAVTGSGTTSITTTLASNGVVTGTYQKVTIDTTGRVTAGSQLSQADIITALGYTPASISGSSGQTLFSYGALGNTAGTVLNYLAMQSTNTNNSVLQFSETRFANGTDWTTATTRIQNVTDVTLQGYIDFNPQNGNGDIALGAENIVQLSTQTNGSSAGITVNTSANIAGVGGNSPIINFQLGTLNNNNSGFSAFTNLAYIGYNSSVGLLSLCTGTANPIYIGTDGTIFSYGITGGTTGVTIKAGSTNQNQLSLSPSGILSLSESGTSVFNVDNNGNLSTLGSIKNNSGNWISNTNSNVNFYVNNSSGTNLSTLWYDQVDTTHAWKMTAQPGGGGATNILSYDVNGTLTTGAVYVIGSGDSQTGMINNHAGNLAFTVGGQRRIVLDGFYNFGVGGGTYQVIPGDINFFFGDGNLGDGNPSDDGARRRFCMQSDGNAVIYNLSNTALWSADTQTSDERYKENIITYENGLKFINQLRPVEFSWKDGTTFFDNGKKHIGFIAQELEEISDHDAVSIHGEGESRLVHKQAFIPHLVSAVQTLSTENEFLKDKVSKLEERLTILEKLMKK